jgi:hypothetical protein
LAPSGDWRKSPGDFLKSVRDHAMAYLPRPIDSCGFRGDVRAEARGETAHCGLIEKILGVGDRASFRVGRDVCLACCQEMPPQADRINPVIASIIYPLAVSLAAQGADARHMAEVRERAERRLDAEIPPEDATPPWPRRAEVACGYLDEPIGTTDQEDRRGGMREAVYRCRHPGHASTTESQCRLCRDWAEVPGPAPTPLAQLVPARPPRRGPTIRSWAVGVTTAPRRQETLSLCLDSLFRAGWDAPRLFVDSRVNIAPRFAHLPVTLREPAMGAWPNFYLGLAELLLRSPEEDAYVMVQDDAVFYDRENLREYLEAVLWPDWPLGAASLYCPMVYTQPSAGWYRHDGVWVYGAVAFVFPRESAKHLIADLRVLGHRWSRRNEGLANIDLVIGHWASRCNVPIVHPTPSLVQHIGDTSTLWPRGRALGARKADRFAGDLT